MDVFHMDSSSISSTMVDVDTEITEVKFEAHSEFDLNFFDTPDDSMTQDTPFSNPNSVESTTDTEPQSSSINQQHQNMVNVKNGKVAQDSLPYAQKLHHDWILVFYFRFAKSVIINYDNNIIAFR